jgi:hypothetical protein
LAPELQEHVPAVRSAGTLDELVEGVTHLVNELGRLVVSAELSDRAAARASWPACPTCGRRLRSKGWRAREVGTTLGVVRWGRRVGRCPGGCAGSTSAPLDAALALAPNQRHSTELKRKATVLAVFVPLAAASEILARLTRVRLSPSTVWLWVQEAGKRAQAHLLAELEAAANGGTVTREAMTAVVDQMLMLIGADGVMVPFRPNGGSPSGRTVWREVKVGVIARLGERLNRHGRTVTILRQRRLVAVLGDVDALAARLKLEAWRQGLATAACAAWISDGARGLWRVYGEHFAPDGVIGILDFYHTVGQIWTAAETRFWRWLPSAHQWLGQARHQLRHGQVDGIIDAIRSAAGDCYRSAEHRDILERVAHFLDRHRAHLAYPRFKAQGMPLGSGFVESAVKWLVQQRFKGVGMRWSEEGFNNLLMLRLAWANDRFDALFTPSPI